MRQIMVIPTLLLMALSFGLGCGGGSDPPGSVVIPWRVGGQSCEQAGLGSVDVELRYGDVVYDVRRERCSAGQAVFTDVEPGTYTVNVYGYRVPAEGDTNELTPADAAYEATYPEAPEGAGLRVLSGEEARPETTLVLKARKGAIYLRWRLPGGDTCTFAGIGDIEVRIYNRFSTERFYETYTCDLRDYLAGLTEEELQDARRGVRIDGLEAEPMTVELRAFDSQGVAQQQGSASFELGFGDVQDVVVDLEPCTAGCM